MLNEILNNSIITFFIGAVAGFFINKGLEAGWSYLRSIPSEKEEQKAAEFEKTVQSNEFIDFETNVLKNYYGQECFTTILGRSYPVYCIPGKVSYPFKKLCENGYEQDKLLPFEESPFYKEYKKVIDKNIHRPKMQGFMLDHFDFNEDNEIVGMHTWVGTYDENVYTSHILEYEIYKAFLQYQKDHRMDQVHLILRDRIHNGHTGKEVLTSGMNRASLLGVQMLIVYRTYEDDYKAVMIKRSEDVAARPGFYQFVPSGGFEVFENSDEHDPYELKENYNVLWAVYREYMEELILGKGSDYEYGQGGETISKIEKEEKIKEIKKYIQEGNAHFEFLGSTAELCGLRNELSFVLKIDDPKYSDLTFFSNSESKKINLYNIEEVEKVLNTEKINPSSAALWYLFTQNHLYNDVLEYQAENKNK